MTDLDQLLEAGVLLIIETGEYSDSEWDGPVRLLRSVTKRQMADAYRQAWPALAAKTQWARADRPDPNAFMPWLVANGYVEHVENTHSWHVGSYGDFEP